jgi:tripeptidyl-peptidase-1
MEAALAVLEGIKRFSAQKYQRKIYVSWYMRRHSYLYYRCPYVTSVGATRLYDGQSVTDPESAMQVDFGPGRAPFASSGGFSNVFPQADYQAEAVNSFLNANNFPFASYNITAGDSVGAHGGVFNIGGRGIPDVSANGAFFDFILQGKPRSGHGTSLSAPIWGAMINLVRQSSVPGRRDC